MKYWLLVLIAVGNFSYAGELEDCYEADGGYAALEACIQPLSAQAEKNYEKAYAEFLKNHDMPSMTLKYRKEFLKTVKDAKKSWESAVDLECSAEGLLHVESEDPIIYYDCLYYAYNRRIKYYQALEKNSLN
jgi:uncharacterized protein YecT (DUF1311 family)